MSERNTTITHSTYRSISRWRHLLFAALMLQTCLSVNVQADEVYKTVSVADPYLEMRTGPGGGYPKFHVVDRGESVEILKRRTDWFLVRTQKGKEGWVDRAQMERTLQDGGTSIDFGQADLSDFEGCAA